MSEKSIAKKPASRRSAWPKAGTSGHHPGQPRGKRVTFSYSGKPGDKVFLCGSFNDWDLQARQLLDKNGDGNFSVICILKPGRYEYKLFVNGEWVLDSSNPSLVDNGIGGSNNLLVVK